MSKVSQGAPIYYWNGKAYFGNDYVRRVAPGKGNVLLPWRSPKQTGSRPTENIPNSQNNIPNIIGDWQKNWEIQARANAQDPNNWMPSGGLNRPTVPPDTQFMIDFNQAFGSAFGNLNTNTLVPTKKDDNNQLITTEDIKVNNQTIPKGTPLPINYDLDNAQSTAYGIINLLPENLNYKTLASSTDIVAFTSQNITINGVNVPPNHRIDIEITPSGETITSEQTVINGSTIPKGTPVPINKVNGKLDPSSIGTIYQAPSTNRQINPQDYGEDNPTALLYTQMQFMNIFTTWYRNTSSDFMISKDGVPVPPYGALFYDDDYATKFGFDPKGDPLQSVTNADGVQTVYRRYNDKFTISVEKNQ